LLRSTKLFKWCLVNSHQTISHQSQLTPFWSTHPIYEIKKDYLTLGIGYENIILNNSKMKKHTLTINLKWYLIEFYFLFSVFTPYLTEHIISNNSNLKMKNKKSDTLYNVMKTTLLQYSIYEHALIVNQTNSP